MIRKKLSLANWRIWTTSVVAVLALGTTIGLVAMSHTDRSPHTDVTTSTTSTTIAGNSTSTSVPTPTSTKGTIPPMSVVPATISCTQGFFTPQEETLAMNAGSSGGCWRLSNGDTWIIEMTGQPPTPTSPRIYVPFTIGVGANQTTTQVPIAPGGSGFAIDHCALSDASCLSPGSPHPLSGFTMYWAPRPDGSSTMNGGSIFATPGASPSEVIQLSDNDCGEMFFDTGNGEFYPFTDGTALSEGTTPSVAPYAMRSAPLSKVATLTLPLPANVCTTRLG